MQVITLCVGELQTNCYIVCADDGTAAIIDPGADAEIIAACIKKHNLTVKAIWLTHGHDDHIGAVAELKEMFSCFVVACGAEIPILTDANKNLSVWISGFACTVQADKVYHDNDTFVFGGEEVCVLHTPGHTAGSCCYMLQDMLFTGDTLFAGSIGRVDFPTGNAALMQKSLQRLAGLQGAYTVFAGHGDVTTLEKERHSNPYMI